MFDHFGAIAPFYDRIIRSRRPERLIELAGLPVSGRLLDAGGGTGRISQGIKGLASSLVIADLSIGMLKQASTKNGLYPVCTFTERLPFPDGAFERVIMIDALHHVVDQPSSLQELWRVLKSGGRLVIEEPDIRKMTVKVVALAEKLLAMRSHFISPLAIQHLLDYSDARIRVVCEGFNAWVIVDKN
jgi:demethylmenaquinone methyltransferase/2-methoxy-6-polyprenyl-1,4-benzoquinol methylase